MDQFPSFKLDASEIVTASNQVVTAVASMQAKLRELASSSDSGKLKAQIAGVTTEAAAVFDAVSKMAGSVGTAFSKAEKDAKQAGKKVGKAFSEALSSEVDVAPTVRENIKALQAQYERVIALKGKFNESALINLKNRGVSLFPDDRDRVRAALAAENERIAQVNARARAEHEASLATQKAWQEDIAAFRQMEKLRVQAAIDAAAQIAKAEADRVKADIRAQQEDVAAFRRMNDLRVKSAQESAALIEEQQARIAGFRVKSATGVDPRTLLGLAPDITNRSAKASASVFSEAFKAQDAEVAAAKQAADSAAKQENLARAARLAAESKKYAAEKTRELRDAEKELAENSRNTHAAMRGVAAAAGGLFLTYGAMLPLMAAFGAAMSIREALTEYKDFEYQLKFVQAVAGDTSVSLKDMMASVAESAKRAGAAPIEAAQGLRILAQSGLGTREALDALPAILNLSIVGELGMAQAAETATGAVNAFGLGVDNVNRVVDVFFQSAAVSNTSVQKISESMKQASTIAERYKVSVEDVGVALVAMAKRNITGSSAGTALTQMFDELATPRGEGKKVASMLGITLFDPMKHDTKEFFETFVPELRKKLKEFDPESQTYILNRLTNNRGAKALSAILGMSDEDLADLKVKLNDSTGSAARAVIELKDSVQGDLDKLKATFTETLSGAGAGGADAFRTSIQKLQEVMASKAVQDGASALVWTFTNLLKLTALVGEGWSKLYGWLEPVKELLDDIGLKLTDGKQTEDALKLIDSQIQKEKEYQSTLQGTIDKLKEKLGISTGPGAAGANPIQDAILAAQLKLQKAQDDYDKAVAETGMPSMATAQKGRLVAARAAYNALIDQDTARLRAMQASKNMEEEQRRLEREAADRERKKNQAPAGSRHFAVPDLAGANSAYSEARREAELAASARRQAFNDAEEDVRHQEALLKDSYDRGTIKYGEYQSRLEQLQRDASARRRSDLQAELAAMESDGAKLLGKFQAAKGAGSQADQQKVLNDMEALRQKWQATKLEVKKLDDKDEERASDALTKAIKPANDMVLAAEREASANRLNVDQELAKLAAKRNGAQLSEKEAFVQETILRITNAQADALRRLETQYQQLLDNGSFDNMADPAVLAAWVNAQQAIEKAKKDLTDSQDRVRAAAAEAFDNKKVDDFAKSLNKGIVDALLDAGHDGGKSLWRAVQDELLKKPLRVAMQGLLEPYTQAAARGVMGMFGVGGGADPSFMGPPSPYSDAGGIAGNLGTVGAMFGAGGLGGSLAAGAGWMTGATTLGGSLAAAGSLMGTGTAAGVMSGIGMAAGALGPIALAAMAAYALISNATKGEKRSGGQYAYSFDGMTAFNARRGTSVKANGIGATFLEGPSGGDPAADAVTKGIDATVANINQTLAALGSDKRLTGFQGGYEGSNRGRGGVFSGGTLTGGKTFGESGVGDNYAGTLFEQTSAQTLSVEDAAKNFAEDLKQSTLQALQAADVPGVLGDYLRQLGDVEQLHGEQLDRALGRIQKALTEKQQLEDQIFELTHNDTEKVAKARERELAALDETNVALAKRVYALQDATAGTDKAFAALTKQVDKLKPIYDAADRGVKDLIGLDTETSAKAGYDFIQQALADAGRGVLPDADKLTQAIDAAKGGISTDNFGSQFEYDKARLNLAGDLANLRDTVAPGLSDMDKTLAYWQEQIDLQRGVLTSNVSIAQAVENLSAALVAEKSARDAAIAATSAPAAVVASAAPSSAAPADTTTNTKTINWNGQWYTPEEWAAMNAPSQWEGYAYARGGDHPGGWAMVGEEGPELAYLPPARIYNTAQTQDLLSSSDSGNETALMRQDLRDGQSQTLLMLSQIYKMFKTWDQDGMPGTRQETV